ncbi:MAG: NAD(P)H-quinone oxidoreductase subunit I, chloroplastic [Candidatus Dichloromethanomonas elyunquensis]|nr:MAG: NAD(P)H-quinone oxidoreductase subunit I, chloroplastic [Candidatus Dichloromethanomonas elyunquensis]
MIKIKNKEDCCGCSACANACPAKSIVMKRDDEGFLYPSIDLSLCKRCGLCEKVCPVLNQADEKAVMQKLYIVQNKDDIIRKESTSGGAFTPIAEYVIAAGGAVFGAAFEDDDHFRVIHQYVETSRELWKFRGSKYLQSEIGNTYSQTKNFLDSGRLVCYSGTPCQIAGLKAFLRKDYENLMTVDVVCRAVPSPLVFEKYLEVQKRTLGDNIKKIRFRDKYYGYSYSTMSIYAKPESKQKDYHRGIESDLWLRAFFSGIIIRPSCVSCIFRKSFQSSDFTIWDCFNVRKYAPEFDDNQGTTRLLIKTSKGIAVFEEIKKSFRWKEIGIESVSDTGKERAYSEATTFHRDEFFLDLNSQDPEKVFHKYFPYTWKVRFLHNTRYWSYRLGIYPVLKKMWNVMK